jgi:tight adherence protein B
VSTPIIALIIFLAAGSALATLGFLIRDLLSSRRRSTAAGPAARSGPVRLRRLPRRSGDSSKGGPLKSFDRWFERLVRETGLGMTAVEAMLLLVLCGTALAAAMFVWNEQPLTATIGMLLGMAAALVYLVVRRMRHVKLLQEQLPTALDMLARGLRAGQSLDEALELVGQRSPQPLAKEFRFCAHQLAMGLSMPAVMRSLVDRVRLFDVRIFTTTLAVHRQTGGNVAKVLERLASVIRDRLNYRRQLRATTGAGRLSAILIAMIGPLLFVYLFWFHPQYLHAMLDSSLGRTMLMVAILLEVTGLVWTARLLKPTY